MATWFEITYTGEPTEADWARVAELAAEGFTSGQLLNDDEPADSCEGQDSTEDEREAMQRTCDDCGAAPGEPCSWSCSSNFD
jgi:hypothetical protein